MARKLNRREETDFFRDRVIEAAKHHAYGMVGPINTIYSRMIDLIDFGRDTVEVFERNGELARTTWVTLQGYRMVFTYSYPKKCILLKPETLRRDELASFRWNEAKEITLVSLNDALRKIGIRC